MRRRLLQGRRRYCANPEKANWVVFYFRGICYERSKQWPKAEADLKKALELFPEQPHVLNYLGYSWIDQGINLDEGMAMIKTRRAAAAGRRLHRRLARLGLFPHRQLRGSGQAARARDRAQAGRPDHQRSSRRRLLARRPRARGANSSGRMRAISSPIRKSCRRSRPSSNPACPRRPRRRPRPAGKEERQRRLRPCAAIGFRVSVATRKGSCQNQSDVARARPPR